MANIEQYKKEIVALQPQVVAWRRHFHKHAELSFHEVKTAAFIEETLGGFPGVEVKKLTPTSVVGVLRGPKPGRTVALRADIDALPMKETNEFDYVSLDDGAMHSCGHDGHAAMLLATAKVLAAHREELAGSVVFIFQHAEELPPGGAAELVAAGVMDGVDEVYGLHLSSNFPTGTFGVRSGALTSATDAFDMTIRGKGGHSSMPEQCIDPILIGSEVVTALQSIRSRRIGTLEPAVISVCRVQSGEAYNIIPDEMTIAGSVRTFSPEVRANVEKWLGEISRGVAAAHGGSCDYQYTLGYSTVVNDEALTEGVESVLRRWYGDERILHIDPLMPGEDFSAFSEVCPGCFIEVGTRDEAKGTGVPHHNPAYRMDEEALRYGVGLFVSVVLDRLQGAEG